MMAFAKMAITLLLPLTLPVPALANTPPGFTLDGTLYDSPSGTAPLRDNAVRIRVQILPPTGGCVLYDEEQTVDTSASDGAFSIQVGSATASAKRVVGSDAGNSMVAVFQNKTAITGAAACSYTPALGATRRARVIVTPSGGPADQLEPDLVLSSVPNALVADTLQGIAPEGFLRLNSGTLTQANVENVFSPTKYSILDALLAGTGAASSGSYTIDAGTGGSGGIDFNTNGSTKASIASNGNFNVDSGSFFVDATSNRVGIGTSTPGASLDLGAKTDAVILPKGDASQRPSPAAEGMLRFNSVSKQLELYNGTTWANADSPWTSATGGINYAGGKVGIGTTAPNHYLDVRAPHHEIARFKNSATSGDRSALFELENGNATPSRWSFTVGGTGNGAALSAGEFYVERYGLGPVMTINANGEVGIGTKTPGTNLHVAGNGDTSIKIDSGAASRAAQIEINRGGGLDSWIGPSGSNSFDFATAEAIPFTFSNSGYQERLRITADGNIGVGTVPTYKLDVDGDLRITGTPYRTGGDIAWTVPSDARLKDVLRNYEYGLEEIAKLSTVRFRYKAGNAAGASTDKEYIGVLAQDVQKLIPEAVSVNDKNGFLNLNSSPIFWSLVNAVKELKERSDRALDQITTNASTQKRELEAAIQENQAIKAENQAIKAYLCAKDPSAPFCQK